ncbi:MAG: sensor histidine kinase [Candidatus Limnocylindria bacterium]
MAKTATAGAPATSFDRMQAQATDSVRRDARRVRELAERFRSEYRERLEDWVRMRAQLDGRRATTRAPAGGAARATATRGTARANAAAERLRAHHDQAGRELVIIQSRLKRLDVAARQLELVTGYLGSPDSNAVEPSLTDTDQSHATVPLRIIQAQEGERQRLAEVVHDGPAQVLTNAIFQVEYLDRVIDDAPRTAHAELAFLRTMLRDGLDEVRGFIADLRPPAVDVGLAQAMADAGAAFAARHGIAVEVDVNGIDAALKPDEKASVLRILQEALQNVRKHSAASQVRIGLESGQLVIGDNGRGFDVMRLASGASHNFGLHFMRERAELMGSTLQIESRQGEGTRILLRLPTR